MNRALRDNIETLSARARTEAAHAPLSQRIADRITTFTGSMTFVFVHVVLFGTWIAANTIGLPILPRFDPSLVVLAMPALLLGARPTREQVALQQRIFGDARSWPRQPGNGIFLHGVSSPVTSNITEDTPPPASSTKFGYSPRRRRRSVRSG